MSKWFAGAIFVMAALMSVSPANAYTQTFDRVVPISANGALRLENVNGLVDVRAWDRNNVEIRAVKTAASSDDLNRVTIAIESQPDWVHVLTRYPQDQSVDVNVEYHISVPRGVALESIVTVNGDVRATNLDSGGALQTVNGDVEVYDCAGSFSARTTNGNIREELRSLGKASTALETMNGSVLLALPASAGAQLDAQTMNGEIHSERPILMQGSSGHGSFQGKLGPGGAPLRIRAVNGSIQIAVWKATI
jgi:hypothetical protein